MRKQRRAADLEDHRDRVRMGLIPADAPKVKLSNLMRVLTSEAVSDPTLIEARVRREMNKRKDLHEKTNMERMLTPDQRREKKAREMEGEETKRGTFGAAFKLVSDLLPSCASSTDSIETTGSEISLHAIIKSRCSGMRFNRVSPE